MEKIKQLLKAQGLTDEQIETFIDEGIKDKFIPKHRFDEVNEKNKQLVQDVSSRDEQIKQLSKFEGDNSALKQKVEELEKANKEKDEQNAQAIKNLKIDNAVNYALSGKVQEGYTDIVLGLIDKSLIVLKDDGTVSGLEEQISKIKEQKSLLFVEEGADKQSTNTNQGFKFKGTDPADSQRQTTKSVSENFVNSLIADKKEVSESTKSANEYYFGKQ